MSETAPEIAVLRAALAAAEARAFAAEGALVAAKDELTQVQAIVSASEDMIRHLRLQIAKLGRDPHGGEIFCFRGRKGDLIKILWHDGVGMSLYLKRLEAGKFIWPVSQNGSAVPVSAAQLGYLLEGIDWRNPRWTQRPASAG